MFTDYGAYAPGRLSVYTKSCTPSGAAGPELERYCEQFAPLALGKAILTPAFNLPNEFVIHTRAANYVLDDDAEKVLGECVEAVFAVANEHKIASLAIPAIGTGVFKFPPTLCALIMAKSIIANKTGCVELVRVCVADKPMRDIFVTSFQANGISLEV